MIRQGLLRQGRSLISPVPSRSISQLHSHFRLRHLQPLSSAFVKPFPPRLERRWLSGETDAEAKTNPDLESVSTRGEAADQQTQAEDPLKRELEAKNREIIDLKDKYLRSVADFRNLQERTRRDVAAARDFAIQRFATDLIESIDNLERALGSVPPEALSPDSSSPKDMTSNTSSEDPLAASEEGVSETDSGNKDLLNLHAGLKMTESILMSTLKKHGLERFDPQDEGRKFDPRLDEATFMTKVEGRQDGDVFHTQSKGFLLNGRVIRPAKVGIVKNS